jgi:integrase
MPSVKLDQPTVERLVRETEPTKDTFYWDNALPGFGLRVRKGKGLYIVQYKMRTTGKSGRPSIGDARILSHKQAREQARKLLADIVRGVDPQREKAEAKARARHTFSAAVAEYLDFKAKTLRPASLKVARIYLQGKHLARLHGRPLADLEQFEVATVLKEIARTRSDHTAAAVRTSLSAFLTWSMREGLCGPRPVNVAALTNPPPSNTDRDRVLTDAELVAIWRACQDDDFGRIVKLVILTACRRQEIGSLRWPEVDVARRVIVLPAERTKNRHPHTVPLVEPALEIIRTMPRMLTSPYVFGARSQGFKAWTKAKAALDKRAGVADWRQHDLRRTAATRMADDGVNPWIIETVLGHSGGHKSGVAGIYNKSNYESEVRAALERWAARVEEIASKPRLLQRA